MNRQDIRNLFSTDEAFENFEKKFNQNELIKRLRNSITNSQRAFRIVQAQQLQQKLYQVEYDTAKSLLDEEKKKEEKLNIFKTNIKKEDIEKIIHLGLCLDVICDCAETYLMDIGDILKSYGEGYSYDGFDGVKKALGEVRKQLSALNKNSDYRKYNAWGDLCDELIDEIKEKVLEIDKRTKEEREGNG